MRSIVSVAQNLKRIYSETNCSIFKEFDVKIKDFRIDPLATKCYIPKLKSLQKKKKKKVINIFLKKVTFGKCRVDHSKVSLKSMENKPGREKR